MIEIDILPASSERKGGDCALIRIGTFDYITKKNNQFIILIDAGYQENADRIKNYLSSHYNTNKIDAAIITHPDIDHISGLKKLLDDDLVTIEKTYIHDPWLHAHGIFNRTLDGRRTVNSIKNAFENTLKVLSEVLEKVGNKNTEPFGLTKLPGVPGVSAYILGPSVDYYHNVLHQFPGMEGFNTGGSSDIYSEDISDYDPNMDHFLDNPHTSPKNNSSAIILLHDSNSNPIALFTGDAGVEAINEALDIADANHIAYKNVSLFQIPHHGSIKNISEDLIDRISPKRAYVSAPPEKLEHPSRLVLNYFHKSEIGVYHIRDKNGVVFSFDGASSRPDWSSAEKVPFFQKVYRLKNTLKRYLGYNYP